MCQVALSDGFQPTLGGASTCFQAYQVSYMECNKNLHDAIPSLQYSVLRAERYGPWTTTPANSARQSISPCVVVPVLVVISGIYVSIEPWAIRVKTGSCLPRLDTHSQCNSQNYLQSNRPGSTSGLCRWAPSQLLLPSARRPSIPVCPPRLALPSLPTQPPGSHMQDANASTAATVI